ncbi:MAG: ROK family protein [Candidatus Eisenbacteria bacterium]|uniref:ROK family protein n=1 Tax=Eiseniibacteriota bacterium TaxID=2212470 RepID=A0A538U6X1_UNCEI|nr:MAG: ROK family protein [Candidatus Eisenbacteria bacterium]
MANPPGPITLSIDIGGTGIKAMRLDRRGRPASDRERERTPKPATPTRVLTVVAELAARLPGFDRASVGFPGVLIDGVVRTAANLHPSWIGRRPVTMFRRILRAPVRVINDADMQGLGIVEGRGSELVVTLGTGIGSALFLDGRLVPKLELGHHPFRHGQTYEQQLGDGPLKHIGARRWNRRVKRAVEIWLHTFNPRRLHLGGGNARLVTTKLPEEVRIGSNLAGLLGGIRLWDETDPAAHRQ